MSKLFTLSGGHLFSIYDGCRDEGIDIVDVRHEQSAAFAAEGWAKATREPGVAALTAGPGVTNGMSGMASALQNGSPMRRARRPRARVALGPGLAPGDRPHPVRRAASPSWRARRQATAEIPGLIDEALRAAAEPPTGPAFVDFPLDQVFMESDVDADAPGVAARPADAAGRGRRRAGPRGRAAARGEQAGDHGRHRALLGARRAGARAALRGAVGAGLPERPGARLRARRPPDVLLPRARRRAEGRRRGARRRRADGLPARLRRLVRRGHADRRDRLGAVRSARTRARSRPSSTAAWPPRSTRCARAPPAAPSAAAG